ncbi:UDP-N-acetylmuramoyl-L-alanine--D-glutamate ligase [bacterium]|nr:UDP-N-acetylmuramoyl-L-alanine--D-glutamate ligase [bacterium]
MLWSMGATNERGKSVVSEEFASVSIDQLRGKRVVVMGLGSFGGGVGVVRFLAGHGAATRISDTRTREQLAASVALLDDIDNIDWRLGEQDASHFEDADLVVINPAVRPDHPLLRQLIDRGVPLTTEMNLFWQLNRGRVVAVTGSNGKSTTTALIHALLEAGCRRCWLGGNIGGSLLPIVDQIEPSDDVVLELSSFQLERLNGLRARPDIAVVTNFAPNHLDWHGTLEAYAAAKQSILRWQTAADWAVLNANDEMVSAWPGEAGRVAFGAGGGNVNTGEVKSQPGNASWLNGNTIRCHIDGHNACVSLTGFRLRGRHNQENALAAVAAATIAGVDSASIERGLSQFEPLPHRLQLIGEFNGRFFYNDSIATTPESAIAALNAFDEPIVLLAGGYDKQVDLSRFAAAIGARVKAAALLGTTGPRLAERLGRCPSPPTYRVAASFRDAVCWAIDRSTPGDVVLLSPGCASYDWFQSFEDRGRQFIAIVRELANTLAVPADD